jgi:hypothetical protein
MTDDASNTGKNRKPGTFEPGDARINRKGRPKSFDAWRTMLVALANEPAVQRDKENKVKKLVLIQIPLVHNGLPVFDEAGNPVMVDHYATNVEMIARQWMSDPKHQQEFIEGAYGKVPQPIDITGDLGLLVKGYSSDIDPDDWDADKKQD